MQPAPAVLYHYTTQAGLLGILGSGSLWASKIHYLNDSAEYALGFDLCTQHLDELLKGERSRKKKTKLSVLKKNLRQISRMNVCVASFSARDDLLSQWRAYTERSVGFSIGFDSEKLSSTSATQEFRLAKCIYEPERHRELVERIVAESLAEDFNTVETRVDPNRPNVLIALHTGGNFAQRFAQLAAELKNPAFHEEAEWRLVSNSGVSALRMSFRPGLSMLVPYVSVPLGDLRAGVLKSVTVGPTPHPQLAEEAVHSLLAHFNLAQVVKIHRSKAPYRAW